MELKDRVVLVSGAAGGIGRAIVARFLSEGARVVALDRDDEGLRRLREENNLEDALTLLTVDVTRGQEVARAVEETIERFHRIDGLICNQGQLHGIGPMDEVDAGKWWGDLEVNLLGTFHLVHSVLPHMKERNEGTILLLTGGGFSGPNPAGSGYGCSKAALGRLTDTLAEEIGNEWNIRVYGFAPGFVRSGLTEHLAKISEQEPRFRYVRDWLEEGRDNSAEGVAESLTELMKHSDPDLSGRIFYFDQDLGEIFRQAKRVRKQDLLQLRYRPL